MLSDEKRIQFFLDDSADLKPFVSSFSNIREYVDADLKLLTKLM